MADKNPKALTIKGRVSWPIWTYQQALDQDSKSQWPKPNKDDVAPSFTLLVEQDQLDKIVTHLLDEFLPYCVAQEKAGEKRDALTQKQADKIRMLVESGDWEDQPPFIPIKVVHEKTAPMAPECVAGVKLMGPKGGNIELRATAQNETELAIPDADIIQFPVIKPINETVHDMYPGAMVAATINLYAYVGTSPGIGAGANVAVYLSKYSEDRFGGGGTSIDEDDILFLED